MASLQDSSLEEEQFTAAIQAQGLRHSAAATALPLSHGAARKWFYKDPQGEIQGARGQREPCSGGHGSRGMTLFSFRVSRAQLSDRSPFSLGPGPFTTQEMAEWFQAGYFSMALLVKRGCDEGFQPLGEVIKMWGRVPFAPGPSPPPLLVSMSTWRGAEWGRGRWMDGGGWCGTGRGQSHRSALALTQGNMDQERLKKQQELAAAALYQQLQHQQFLQLIGRYGGLEGLVGQAGRWLCGLPTRRLSLCLQPAAPTVCTPGKGHSGGPDAATAAAAHCIPAAAPGSQTTQVWSWSVQQWGRWEVGLGGWGADSRGTPVLRILALLPRGGDQNLLPTMNRSLSVPDSGPLWDIHTSASSQSGVWPACPLPPVF